MNRTASREAAAVPLQKANGSWINEPGYGGTAPAWEAFDAAITRGLSDLELRFPGPAKMPTARQSATEKLPG